ncbi:SPASM domain-containing protein, partial [Candidatus Babeliales bacterium]|nr:SPASM domain-containing protein [Candidatus Babeliales bacterium]
PELTVRAGGIDGKRGAVTPCCQTMGPPNEEKSVLGHVSDMTLEEIWFGKEYEELREAHRTKNFDSIDYCKDCDFLIDDPEVLVWSNAPDASTYHMIGTNMDLRDFE